MKRCLIVVMINLICFLSGAALLFAAQLPLIRYQGQAVDSRGVPLEGPYTLTFRLYTTDTAGTPAWEEAQVNVPLSQGQFSVLLGQTVSLANVDWSQPVWLAMQINAETELAPRQRIASVPLAIRASVAEALTVPVTTSTISDDAHALVPMGAIILWQGASCPAGYARVTTYEDRFLMSSATAGTVGGSRTHDHGGATGSHVLTINEIPSHSHSVTANAAGEGGNGGVTGGTPNVSWDGTVSSSSVGGDQGHQHSIAPVEHLPPFKTILLCEKS